MIANIEWLQGFYAHFCNGNWEHRQGCDLTTLDNPGWRLTFNLEGTPYADEHLSPIQQGAVPHSYPEVGTPWLVLKERGEAVSTPWLGLEKTGSTVTGACGPLQLDELIGAFRTWVEHAQVSNA